MNMDIEYPLLMALFGGQEPAKPTAAQSNTPAVTGDNCERSRTLTLDNCPALLTVPELATILRIGRNSAYCLVSDGSIPGIRIGRQLRVYREDVMNYVTKLRKAAG